MISTWTEFLKSAEDSERIKYAGKRLAILKETALWNTATRNNTPGMFRTYLNAYPSGEYSAQAREKYGQLAQSSWIAFKNNPSLQTLTTFKAEYAASPWSDSAQVLYTDLAMEAFKKVAHSVLESELDMFADTWKGTAYAAKAVERKHELWNTFDWVKKANTKVAFERFVRANANSPHPRKCSDRAAEQASGPLVTSVTSAFQ